MTVRSLQFHSALYLNEKVIYDLCSPVIIQCKKFKLSTFYRINVTKFKKKITLFTHFITLIALSIKMLNKKGPKLILILCII
jgi:hypothetical protein